MNAIIVLCLALVMCTGGLRQPISYETYVSKGGLPLPERLRTGKWYNPGQTLNDTFIVGGYEASLSDAPWIVSLANSFSHFCGGAVLTSRTILTAAHCIDGKSPTGIRLRVGSALRGSGGTQLGVSRIIKHSSYNPSTIDYDIALLITSSVIPINGNTVRAVSLPTSEAPTGASIQVAGWGTTSQGSSSLPSSLRKVNVNIVSRSTCNSLYGGAITERMICANVNGGGRDACQGDSGGPFTLNGVQYGVVSWGRGCAQASYPGVYTNVANLLPWINANKQ